MSDFHLGTGRGRGMYNTHEDFFQDEKFAQLLELYSTEIHEHLDVELIINGDFFDLVKVHYKGDFTDEITEEISINKVRRCVAGHPVVMNAIRNFLSMPGKSLTYIIGNHDLEMWYEKAQEVFTEAVAYEWNRERIKFIYDREFYELKGGIFVGHGNTIEAMNRVNFKEMTVLSKKGERILNLPWGVQFVIKVFAPMKAERPIIDLVRPLSTFILYGLVFDIRFTLKILFKMIYYFFKTRFSWYRTRADSFFKALQFFFEDLFSLRNFDDEAKHLLEKNDRMNALILGHSHAGKIRRISPTKVYVNTGTWVKLINLDIKDIGTRLIQTYAAVEYYGDRELPEVRLLRWRGRRGVFEEMNY
ncbi:MAG: hypothetical protein FJ088_02560 [Deltaproteobacteria bacterium]|nr:hypothetical protein [Deltaproteobacteria bacterium]